MTQATLDVAVLELSMGHAISGAANVATWVRDTAQQYGIHVEPSPADAFAGAVSRLSDADVSLDPVEQLLLALHRHDVVSDAQRLALHASYLRQEA